MCDTCRPCCGLPYGRFSAQERGVQHWPQFRRSLDAVADRSKTLRQGDEIRVTELNTGGPPELHLLFPSDDPVAVVPPDQHDEWKVHRLHNLTWLSRNALVTTETELNAMAAPAKIGDSSSPKAGYNTPAAIGMPNAL